MIRKERKPNPLTFVGLRIPQSLKSKIAEEAKKEQRSLSQFLWLKLEAMFSK